jgi:type III secretion protein Q
MTGALVLPQVGARAAVWPRLSRNEALARTQLAQKAKAVKLKWEGREWLLQMEPLAPQLAARWTTEAAYRIRLSWAGAPMALHLHPEALRAWLQGLHPQTPLPDLAGLDSELLTPWVEVACESWRSGLAALQRGPVSLEIVQGPSAISSAQSALPHTVAVRLTSAQAPAEGFELRVDTDSLGLMLLSGAVASQAAGPNDLLLDDLPVPLRATLGHTMLSSAELRSLRAQDVVLMDEAWCVDGQSLRLVGRATPERKAGFLQVRLDAQHPHQLTVAQAWAEMEMFMTDTQTAAAPADLDADPTEAPQALDKLPVTLSFDLGQRSVSLAQLRSLQPGQVIELTRPISGGTVQLRANGALIGSGELVEVDGRMGVSITALGA